MGAEGMVLLSNPGGRVVMVGGKVVMVVCSTVPLFQSRARSILKLKTPTVITNDLVLEIFPCSITSYIRHEDFRLPPFVRP